MIALLLIALGVLIGWSFLDFFNAVVMGDPDWATELLDEIHEARRNGR